MDAKTQALKAFEILKAVADAIREVKEIPSGHLYANLLSVLDLTTYQSIIQTLKNTGLVVEKNNLLTWIEPV